MLASITFDTALWFHYAFYSMAKSPVLPFLLIVIAGAILLFALGLGWGRLWNKKWKLDTFRCIIVLVVSLIGATSLAGANALYGNRFFETAVVKDISVAVGDNLAELSDNAPKAKSLIDRVLDMDNEGVPDSERETITLIPQELYDSYIYTLGLFWTGFGFFLLALIVGVARAAYKDIEEIKPY